MTKFPQINPALGFMSITKFRRLKAEDLKDIDKVTIISRHSERLAVLIPFELYEKALESGE